MHDGRVEPYAAPRPDVRFEDCLWYHTMDVPGHGVVEGAWDLRGGASRYLGDVEFRGKCVLEMGTASGFLCFHMERAGAEVVAFDLDSGADWDIVPYARADRVAFAATRRVEIERLHDAFWFCHKAFRSKARAVYGTAYAVPDAIGPVDVATFGSILLHLRDPFRALESALRLTKHTVIVTDLVPRGYRPLARVRKALSWMPLRRARKAARRMGAATTDFIPDASRGDPMGTWWHLSPDTVVRMLAVLGFEETRVTFHSQPLTGRDVDLFTVVAQRTAGP